MGEYLIGDPMRVFQPHFLIKILTVLLLRVRKAQPRESFCCSCWFQLPFPPPPFKWRGYYLSTLLGQGDNLAIECFDTHDERFFIKPKYIFFPKKEKQTEVICCQGNHNLLLCLFRKETYSRLFTVGTEIVLYVGENKQRKKYQSSQMKKKIHYLVSC